MKPGDVEIMGGLWEERDAVVDGGACEPCLEVG